MKCHNLTAFLSVVPGFLLLLYSCTSENLEFENGEALVEYIHSEASGYTKIEEEDGIKMTVTYLPTSYWVDKYIDHNLDKASFIKQRDSLQNFYGKYSYFQLSISHAGEALLNKNKLGRGQYSSLLQNLSFRLNSFVDLTIENRSIELSDYRYENFYGLAKSDEVLMVFEKLDKYSGAVIIKVQPLLEGMEEYVFEFKNMIFKREFLLKDI